MDNISSMSKQQLDEVKIILTDINDTLTTNGRLKSDVFIALEKLSNSSYIVIPVTGRCAEKAGAIAKVSSIHVNCWIGNYNKLTTNLTTLEQVFGVSKSSIQNTLN